MLRVVLYRCGGLVHICRSWGEKFRSAPAVLQYGIRMQTTYPHTPARGAHYGDLMPIALRNDITDLDPYGADGACGVTDCPRGIGSAR